MGANFDCEAAQGILRPNRGIQKNVRAYGGQGLATKGHKGRWGNLEEIFVEGGAGVRVGKLPSAIFGRRRSRHQRDEPLGLRILHPVVRPIRQPVPCGAPRPSHCLVARGRNHVGTKGGEIRNGEIEQTGGGI